MRVPWDSALVVSAPDTVLAVAQVCASMLPGQLGTALALPPFPFSPVPEVWVPASLRRAGLRGRVPGYWARAVVFLTADYLRSKNRTESTCFSHRFFSSFSFNYVH